MKKIYKRAISLFLCVLFCVSGFSCFAHAEDPGEIFPLDYKECEPYPAYIITDPGEVACYLMSLEPIEEEDLLKYVLAARGREYPVEVCGVSKELEVTRIRLYNGNYYWIDSEYIYDSPCSEHSLNCYSADEIREICSAQGVTIPTHFNPVEPSERIVYIGPDDWDATSAAVRIFKKPSYTKDKHEDFIYKCEGRTYVQYYGQYNRFALLEFNGTVFWLESQYLDMVYGADIQVGKPPFTLEELKDECTRQHVTYPAAIKTQEPVLMVMYDPEELTMTEDVFIWGRRNPKGDTIARVSFTYVGRTPVYCYGYYSDRALITQDGELFWINRNYIIEPVGNNAITGFPYVK